MSIKQRLLRWVSYIVPCKIPAGVNTTTLEETEHPGFRLIKNAPKYQMKSGQYFVYVGSRVGQKGQLMHELLHIETNITFAASDVLFKTLFEKSTIKPKG